MIERALATVSAGAIERNCARLAARLSAGTQLCAVVKADGYGHGAAESARAALAGGATWLGVVTAKEAEDLRLEGLSGPIIVLGPLRAEEIEQALTANADVAAWGHAFLDELAWRSQHHGVVARVHVKLDSGMGRFGTFDADQARGLVERAAKDESLEAAGLWTHFATADDPGSRYFSEQLARFSSLAETVKVDHPDVLVHAANSAGTLRDEAAHFDMVRCGIAVYGLDPMNVDPDVRGLEPALTLSSYVSEVKRFPAGTSAGYGRQWIAEQDTWVALVPIGYGDGVRRGLSNNAEVLIHGQRHPLVGTISMDSITVNLGPETDVAEDDEVVLIGRQGDERILCEEVARRLDTINYEVTCGLSARTRRAHVA